MRKINDCIERKERRKEKLTKFNKTAIFKSCIK